MDLWDEPSWCVSFDWLVTVSQTNYGLLFGIFHQRVAEFVQQVQMDLRHFFKKEVKVKPQ